MCCGSDPKFLPRSSKFSYMASPYPAAQRQPFTACCGRCCNCHAFVTFPHMVPKELPQGSMFDVLIVLSRRPSSFALFTRDALPRLALPCPSFSPPPYLTFNHSPSLPSPSLLLMLLLLPFLSSRPNPIEPETESDRTPNRIGVRSESHWM